MIDSSKMKIIISVILGLGIATLFRRVCEGRNCIIIKGPSVDEIEGSSYKYKNKCYHYKSKTVGCNL